MCVYCLRVGVLSNLFVIVVENWILGVNVSDRLIIWICFGSIVLIW